MMMRLAHAKDMQAIVALYQSEKWFSFTEEKVKKLFSSRCSHCLVVEEGQTVLGFARYLTDEIMTTFLAEIIIAEAYRGKGLGRQLLAEIHRRHPLTRIDCLSDADAFYQAAGFHTAGTGFRKN